MTRAERIEGERTLGMTREQAIAVPGRWARLVRTEAHMTTGWHRHGVVGGSLRMGGVHVVEAGPGDFLHVPKGAVHREGNPGDEKAGSSWLEQGVDRVWATSTGRPSGDCVWPARHVADWCPLSGP